MKASISKSEIGGKVAAPPSKSYTIRALMCAALARGESEIIDPLTSDDTEASLDVLSRVGIDIHQYRDQWLVKGGNFHKPDSDLFCRESGATLRFMAAISSLIPGECRLSSAPSLAVRPIKPLIQALGQLGVDCLYQGKDKPVVVKGGKLTGGTTELPGNISSQYVSALLFISPFAEEGVRIRLTTPLESQAYVMMTTECLQNFGINIKSDEQLREFEIEKQTYRPDKYTVEGDWSSASYLLALGALCGEVKVGNLNTGSLQGDSIILKFLKDMGSSVTIGKSSVTVKKSVLRAIKADLTECTDLLPTMAVLAAAAEGASELTGIERARLKESDRVSALREGLEAMGIKVIEESNRLIVTGSPARGSEINSHNDHRIAMAFSLLGTAVGGIVINEAGCVAKTYPEFWDTLKSLGGRIELNDE